MTPELAAARVGKVTASRISDVLSGGKGITRAKYAGQLAAERLTGKPSRMGFSNDSIDHGNEQEPFARMEYEMRNGVMVMESDFIDHPFIPMSGCSPDGCVNDDGLIEIKAPNTHTYIEYLMTGEIPRNYRLQMLWQIAVTRRAWNDFVAFESDLDPRDGYLQIRLIPSQSEITELETEVRKFSAEVDALVKSIIAKRKS